MSISGLASTLFPIGSNPYISIFKLQIRAEKLAKEKSMPILIFIPVPDSSDQERKIFCSIQ